MCGYQNTGLECVHDMAKRQKYIWIILFICVYGYVCFLIYIGRGLPGLKNLSMMWVALCFLSLLLMFVCECRLRKNLKIAEKKIVKRKYPGSFRGLLILVNGTVKQRWYIWIHMVVESKLPNILKYVSNSAPDDTRLVVTCNTGTDLIWFYHHGNDNDFVWYHAIKLCTHYTGLGDGFIWLLYANHTHAANIQYGIICPQFTYVWNMSHVLTESLICGSQNTVLSLLHRTAKIR